MWGDQSKGHGEAMQGFMMIDMGAAITLPMKKWANAHGLTVKKKVAKYISGANGTTV